MPENYLKAVLEEKIKSAGPISFAEFMETALYHPLLGYYSRRAASEDYYTNVDVHPVFSEILAAFFRKEWEARFSAEPSFQIIELGSGGGKLASRILACLQERAPHVYSKCHYTCVEKGTARRQACAQAAENFSGHFSVSEDFKPGAGSLTGIVFSNEFFDALPFHRVLNDGKELREIKIGPSFNETLAPLSSELQGYFKWLGRAPQTNCVGEASLAAKSWIEKIGAAVRKGLVLSIDYGFETEELYSEIRPEGTALCHFKHHANRDFYTHLGEQDITCHVDFKALKKAGESFALESEKLMSQTRFITETGFEEAVESAQKITDPKARLKLTAALRTLVHPEGMGGTFKALLQRKG